MSDADRLTPADADRLTPATAEDLADALAFAALQRAQARPRRGVYSLVTL
jgi:hypothetical protein